MKRSRNNEGVDLRPGGDSFRERALAALDSQELERGRFARKLHDDVAQILSAAGLQLDILRMDLEQQVPEIISRAAEIQNLLDRAIRQIADLSRELHPTVVEHAGLEAAFHLLVRRFQKGFAGTVRLSYDSSIQLPAGAAVAMEKIALEAVANAVRHARCSQIEISVRSAGTGAVLEIRDNGCGFDYALAPHGLGIPMMEHCARQAGFPIQINGRDENGATVTAGGRMKRGHAIQCAAR